MKTDYPWKIAATVVPVGVDIEGPTPKLVVSGPSPGNVRLIEVVAGDQVIVSMVHPNPMETAAGIQDDAIGQKISTVIAGYAAVSGTAICRKLAILGVAIRQEDGAAGKRAMVELSEIACAIETSIRFSIQDNNN